MKTKEYQEPHSSNHFTSSIASSISVPLKFKTYSSNSKQSSNTLELHYFVISKRLLIAGVRDCGNLECFWEFIIVASLRRRNELQPLLVGVVIVGQFVVSFCKCLIGVGGLGFTVMVQRILKNTDKLRISIFTYRFSWLRILRLII